MESLDKINESSSPGDVIEIMQININDETIIMKGITCLQQKYKEYLSEKDIWFIVYLMKKETKYPNIFQSCLKVLLDVFELDLMKNSSKIKQLIRFLHTKLNRDKFNSIITIEILQLELCLSQKAEFHEEILALKGIEVYCKLYRQFAMDCSVYSLTSNLIWTYLAARNVSVDTKLQEELLELIIAGLKLFINNEEAEFHGVSCLLAIILKSLDLSEKLETWDAASVIMGSLVLHQDSERLVTGIFSALCIMVSQSESIALSILECHPYQQNTEISGPKFFLSIYGSFKYNEEIVKSLCQVLLALLSYDDLKFMVYSDDLDHSLNEMKKIHVNNEDIINMCKEISQETKLLA